VNQECNKLIKASNKRENSVRITQQYAAGDKIIIVLDLEEQRSQPKMGKPTRAPYKVTKVHNNGTVTINHGNFDEDINIRRIKLSHSG
jgi:hypothetical protein